MHVKILQKKIITLKSFNLTLVDTLSYLGGLKVTHPTAVREVPCSISGSGKAFYVCFFCFVVVVICHTIHVTPRARKHVGRLMA